jgi:hypothetical protein
MPLDLNTYKPYLDGFDLTDDQKTAMIEALWSIAEEVTDLAYGVHTTQLIQIANDNNSPSEISVIKFFEIAASDPVLTSIPASPPVRPANNDNIPQGDQHHKETGT